MKWALVFSLLLISSGCSAPEKSKNSGSQGQKHSALHAHAKKKLESVIQQRKATGDSWELGFSYPKGKLESLIIKAEFSECEDLSKGYSNFIYVGRGMGRLANVLNSNKYLQCAFLVDGQTYIFLTPNKVANEIERKAFRSGIATVTYVGVSNSQTIYHLDKVR